MIKFNIWKLNETFYNNLRSNNLGPTKVIYKKKIDSMIIMHICQLNKFDSMENSIGVSSSKFNMLSREQNYCPTLTYLQHR